MFYSYMENNFWYTKHTLIIFYPTYITFSFIATRFGFIVNKTVVAATIIIVHLKTIATQTYNGHTYNRDRSRQKITNNSPRDISFDNVVRFKFLNGAIQQGNGNQTWFVFRIKQNPIAIKKIIHM